MDISYPILAGMALSLILAQANQRLASPVIAIVNRWIRWLVFAFGLGYIADAFRWLDRPLWALILISFLLWFLLETVYNWMAVSAMSLSPMPLFPAYRANPAGDEWPMQKRILNVRDWLRRSGYRPVKALRAEIAPGVYLRLSVYQDEGGTTRVQIMFMPQSSGASAMSCVITSFVADGRRIVTDNLHIPYGGFYPERWCVERLPWRRSIESLMARHKRRLVGEALVPFDFDPLSDIDSTQRELDRLNTELGFLVPHSDREQRGKITHEGRYRVWKEIWMLDYLGRSARCS